MRNRTREPSRKGKPLQLGKDRRSRGDARKSGPGRGSARDAGAKARGKGQKSDEVEETGRMGLVTFALSFLGILLVLAGMDLMIMLSKLSRAWGVPVLALGALVLWLAQRRPDSGALLREADEEDLREGSKYQSAPFIYYLTLKERMVPFLWMIGIAIIIADLLYNLIQALSLTGLIHNIASFDIAVLLLGLAMVAYRFVPVRFAKERDFVVLLGGFVFLILILPVMILDIDPDNNYSYTSSPLVYALLTVPMVSLLKLFGLDVSAQENIVIYHLHSGGYAKVGIAISCAGIYSMSFFISGFISYLLVEYRKFDVKAALLLVSGIITAWFANVLRMSLIVLVGSRFGERWFYFTHKYLGTLFFFTWIFIFWFVIFLVLRRGGEQKAETIEGRKIAKKSEKSRKH